MSASAPAAEGEGTPAQPASEKEPEMPGPREESEEEEDEDDDEEEEEEKGGGVASQVMDFSDRSFFVFFPQETSFLALFVLRGVKSE